MPIPIPTYGSTWYNPQTGKADGINKFDPNTGLALQNPNNPVVSGTAYGNGVNALGQSITTATNSAGLTSTYDKMNQMYEDRMKQMKQDYESNLGGIKSTYEEAARVQGDRQHKDYAGRSTSLVTSGGGFLGATQSQQGVLQNLNDTFTQEKQALMSKRDSALQAARDSFDGKEFAIAQQQLQLAKDTEKEIYNRQKDYADQSLAVSREARSQKEFDYGITDKKIKSYEAMSDADFKNVDPQEIAALDANYYPGYTIAARNIAQKAMTAKTTADQTELDIKIADAVNKTPQGQTITLGGKTYKGMKHPARTGSGSAKGLIPATLALQLGVPSLAGKDESDVILSLSLNSAPQWYREYYKATNPTGYAQIMNTPGAIDGDWQIFKSQPDIQAYANSAVVTSRINKTNNALNISAADIAAALKGED
jgi:hypothetical protein